MVSRSPSVELSPPPVGPTGGGKSSTDGERDTTAPHHIDDAGDVIGSDAEHEAQPEENPDGITPKAGYSSKDPRSSDAPYLDAE